MRTRRIQPLALERCLQRSTQRARWRRREAQVKFEIARTCLRDLTGASK
jgi:hypothetical protein